MWNVGEYRKRPQRLSDYLPWAALVQPGVLLNKDGSFLRTVRFRGPDLDSATPHELMAIRARTNNVLRRLGSHWGIWIEAARRRALDYPVGTFPSMVAELMDRERRDSFTNASDHYESSYYLTFSYLPPAEKIGKLGQLFIERADNNHTQGIDYRVFLEYFLAQSDQVINLLAGFMPEIELLDDDGLLTYLHGCVSDRDIQISRPDIPFYLDEMVTDRPLVGGLSPRLGPNYLKTVSIRSYVNRTVPMLLDRLNELPIEYRWVGRYLPMDKPEATSYLNKLRRHWFAKRKNVVTLLKEVITKEESRLEDSDALGKSQDVDDALQELGNDFCAFGEFTLTVTIWDEDERIATEKARAVQQVIDSFGIVSEIEDMNAIAAWLSSLPGHAYANVRRPVISSLNVCDLVPLSAVWSGPNVNKHLNAPVLMQTKTKGSTPFRLNLHQGDVGHTLIAGPTGAGKSTLLNMLAAQFTRYPGARVYIFDKGGSCRALTLGMGGDYYAIGADQDQHGGQKIFIPPSKDTAETALRFQPLALIDQESERSWAQDWLLDILEREKLILTPSQKQELWHALGTLAAMPQVQRTISTLVGVVQDEVTRQVLRHYTLEGPYGHLLDADQDTLRVADWQAFEMESLMHSHRALLPVLTYLFRRLEQRFSEGGAPALLILDEAWLYLTESLFAQKIREWLKVLRKKNVSVLFCTQSLSDVADSPIAQAIIENCLTRIFLPNANAFETRTRAVYESFGLNEKQLQILQTAAPKREYYYQSRDGNRLFELGLGFTALAFCGASTPQDHARMDRLLAEHGTSGFATAYLNELELIHEEKENSDEKDIQHSATSRRDSDWFGHNNHDGENHEGRHRLRSDHLRSDELRAERPASRATDPTGAAGEVAD